MSNGYNFYMQKYPQGKDTFNQEDIEVMYNCWYLQFKDFAFPGEIQNIYTESFAEKDGVRTFIPSELSHAEYECKLQLLFSRATCASDSEAFYTAYCGQLCEYHDTFRNKYATLLMSKRPTVQQEQLYSDTPYQVVEFTFTNVNGITYTKSQL